MKINLERPCVRKITIAFSSCDACPYFYEAGFRAHCEKADRLGIKYPKDWSGAIDSWCPLSDNEIYNYDEE
jgi:hypothetical protein